MDWQTLWQTLPIALGWMVAHSLWQITVIYLCYRLVAWCWRRQGQALYLVALFGLLLASGWAFYTFSTTWGQLLQGASGLAAGPDTPSVFTPDAVQNLADAPGRVVETLPWYTKLVQLYDYFWAGVVGWLWCLAVIVFSLRLSGGYWISRRLRTRGVIVVSEAWQGRCNDWARQLGILRQVCWLESACITEPLTLGFWKPVILFPAGLLLQLPPKQVEVLLLHELAHIRRLDYLANLFQLILEVCFFYHPLFWLLSREVRRQREFACDDQVVQQTTDPLLYARTLTNLQLTFVNRPNPFVMNALGNSAFAQRIYRIAGLHPTAGRQAQWFPFLIVFLLLTTGVLWSSFTPSAEQPQRKTFLIALPAKADFHRAAAARLLPPAPPTVAAISPDVIPDTISPSIVVVEAGKMNIFYIGVDNPITVAVPGYDCNAVQVRLVGNGEIISRGDCQYTVLVKSPGEVRIEIYGTDQGKEKQLGVKVFRAKRIPDPVPGFEGQNSSFIHKADISNIFRQELKAILWNFDFDAECTVVRFGVACLFSKDSDMVEYSIQGNKISPEILANLNRVEPGGRIYLLDVRVKCPGDSATRQVGDRVFTVIE